MSQLLFNYSFCLNFPIPPSPEIARDSLITVAKQQLDSNYDIIFISGEEEIGKSNVLSQFVRTFHSNSFACFLKPLNKYSSLVENVLIDLISQFHYFIHKAEIDSNEIRADFQQFSGYISKLTRLSKGRVIYYIILDGFENIDAKDILSFQELFQQLPVGLSIFKFLISDRDQYVYENFFKDQIKGKIKFKENSILPFGLAEVGLYCEYLNLKHEQLTEILKITSGIPGRVKSIYEKLINGETYDDVFSNISFSDFVVNEINKINFGDNDLTNILALVSLEDVEYNIVIISKILSLNAEDVELYIKNSGFLDIDSKGIVTFKSSYFKKSLKSRFTSKQNFIDESIISYYVNSASDIESIIELPKRYQKSRRFDELLSLLDEAHFFSIIEKKQSYNYLEEQTSIGIDAAKVLNRTMDFFRLTLQKATIAEIKQTFVWEEEIEAKIELKSLVEARKLAESVLLKEERFRHLLFLAKNKKQKQLLIEPDLIESIRVLYNQINPQTFYDSREVLKIVNNLAYILPDLAVEFLEKAYVGEQFTDKDWSLAQLSLLMQTINESEEKSDFTIELASKIEDPAIKSLTNAMSFYNGKGGVREFLVEMHKVDSVHDKLFLIRRYIEENINAEGIEEVVDFAVDLYISKADEISTTATALFDLSLPIPAIKIDNLSSLLNKFESFKGISKEKGPTVSHYKFLINLSIGTLNLKVEDGKLKGIELYDEINKIEDTQLKTEIFAYYYKTLITYDTNRILENEYEILELLMLDIETGIEELLASTANHDTIISNINKELVSNKPDRVIHYCAQLNTFRRREIAFLDALKGYLENQFDDIDFATIQKFYQSVQIPRNKNKAVYEVLKRYNKYDGDIIKDFPEIDYYLKSIKLFYDEELTLKAYCLALTIIDKRSIERHELIDNYSKEISTFIKDVSNVFHKIQFSFVYFSQNRQS